MDFGSKEYEQVEDTLIRYKKVDNTRRKVQGL